MRMFSTNPFFIITLFLYTASSFCSNFTTSYTNGASNFVCKCKYFMKHVTFLSLITTQFVVYYLYNLYYFFNNDAYVFIVIDEGCFSTWHRCLTGSTQCADASALNVQ